MARAPAGFGSPMVDAWRGGDPVRPRRRGAAAVLLHGFPQDWYEWRGIMPRLAERYEVLALDLRGVGESDAPAGGYDAATMAGDVRGCSTRSACRAAHVAGHDIGGWVAYAFARRFPRSHAHRVRSLETLIPGVEPFFDPGIDAPLWHGEFHMIPDLPEALVGGRQAIYFRTSSTSGPSARRHHRGRRRALRGRLRRRPSGCARGSRSIAPSRPTSRSTPSTPTRSTSRCCWSAASTSSARPLQRTAENSCELWLDRCAGRGPRRTAGTTSSRSGPRDRRPDRGPRALAESTCCSARSSTSAR